MNALTSAQFATLAAMLDAEDARARAALGTGASPRAPLERQDPGDKTDVADREIGQRQADVMREHYRVELEDIAAARGRMTLGSYAICRECEEPIPFERLQAYPTAKRCMDCQREHEQKRRGRF
ncbi:TraR/DksA family transcriptional regulator [Cupriavidus metallidurans]|uniref:TraR/DksA family transcriptional regulator n=1 Tax=Cupriavidus metallidurans TaxID=119219 RepID=UPI0005678B21|nr:TraR/DksA C4-type zinc finger protein [Cupriavidus metallidurans]